MKNIAEPNKYKFWYSILTHRRCRIWQHLLLSFIVAVMAVNETANVFGEHLVIIGNFIIIPFLLIFLLDMAVIYFNLFFLVPKLLLRNQYIQYIASLSLSISIYIMCDLAVEYYLYCMWDIPLSVYSAWHSVYNFITDFVTTFIYCIIFMTGVSLTVLFKSLLMNKQIFKSLESKKIQSDLGNLKEQISPSFLSKILGRASLLAVSAPNDASNMLLKLSKILRYQLYDCGRKKVLLLSEIEFLTNYLDLEKEYYANFDFNISKNKELKQVFITPRLFLPFIEQVMKQMESQNVPSLMLSLCFEINSNQLTFNCISHGIVWNNSDFRNASNRLSHLCENCFVSIHSGNGLMIQIEI